LKAYLDIETDRQGIISVIGIYTELKGLVQLYGDDVTAQNVLTVTDMAKTVVTFNGDNFDLPLIKKSLDLDLRATHSSLDLFKEKKVLGIKGGLKELEKKFGIARKTDGMNGYDAVKLWESYTRFGSLESLSLLLEYNGEDVVNLISLESCLASLRGEQDD
jgi:uncharacterized protein YprB with RNaseH-like and TPR domain